MAPAMQQSNNYIITPLQWILKIRAINGYNHSFRITCNMCAVSLLQSRQQRHIKANNNINNNHEGQSGLDTMRHQITIKRCIYCHTPHVRFMIGQKGTERIRNVDCPEQSVEYSPDQESRCKTGNIWQLCRLLSETMTPPEIP